MSEQRITQQATATNSPSRLPEDQLSTAESDSSVSRRVILHDLALLVCLITVGVAAKLHHPSLSVVIPLALLFALSYVTVIGNRR